VASADLVLRVVRRTFGPNPSGAATLIGFNIVETVLEVGEYRKTFTAAKRGIGGVWKECAKEIVIDLRAWVDANEATVRARRRPRRTGVSG
jgi:hypothetical protein